MTAWNKGLTKETDPRVAAIGRATSKSLKGNVPWNKGLTKGTDPRIKPSWNKDLTVETDSRVKPSWNKGETKATDSRISGGGWNRGLTKESDPRIAAQGEAISRAHLNSPYATSVSRKYGLIWGPITGKLPASKKTKEVARKLRQEMGYKNRGGMVVVIHHNDRCHGAERPNDTREMFSGEHSRLHRNLEVQEGTHPWLACNRSF